LAILRQSDRQRPWVFVAVSAAAFGAVYFTARAAALLPFIDRQHVVVVASAFAYPATWTLLYSYREAYLAPSFGTKLTRATTIVFGVVVFPLFVSAFVATQLRWLNHLGLSSPSRLTGTLERVEQFRQFRQPRLRVVFIDEHGREFEAVGSADELPLEPTARLTRGSRVCFELSSGLVGHLVRSARAC